jgi:hypothetical protein
MINFFVDYDHNRYAFDVNRVAFWNGSIQIRSFLT